jgi:ABC-2 type transport system ATP-binding protein
MLRASSVGLRRILYVMPPPCIIAAENLVKEYDGVRALDRATFQVESGDLFALVGPNGAGKTTLLRLLTDILKPDSGHLQLFGDKDLRQAVGRVGYMPEERGLYKNQSALETVAYFAELRGIPRRETKRVAQEALDRVGMGGHSKRKVEELSKGMSQRVQFAATIAHDPELLILDEPFSGSFWKCTRPARQYFFRHITWNTRKSSARNC